MNTRGDPAGIRAPLPVRVCHTRAGTITVNKDAMGSTVHALLHIADSIRLAGPVWAYWAFPMERYCGSLLPAIKSRRFPYTSLNRYVLDQARLTHIKLLYDCDQQLSLQPPTRQSGVVLPSCMSSIITFKVLY